MGIVLKTDDKSIAAAIEKGTPITDVIGDVFLGIRAIRGCVKENMSETDLKVFDFSIREIFADAVIEDADVLEKRVDEVLGKVKKEHEARADELREEALRAAREAGGEELETATRSFMDLVEHIIFGETLE